MRYNELISCVFKPVVASIVENQLEQNGEVQVTRMFLKK